MDDFYCTPSRTTFNQNIDYMTTEVSQYNLYQCWRQNNCVTIKSHHDDISVIIPSTVSKRLENTCWRRWYKEIKQLPVIPASQINWYKDQDITWLYGPKFSEHSDFELPSPLIDHRLTTENLARTEAINIPGQCDVKSEVDDYLSSSVDSGETDFSLGSRGSITSLDESDAEGQGQKEKSSNNINNYSGSLRSALKMSQGKTGKKVKFNYIVSSREYVNGMSFDYDFLDHSCI
ncbi:hypothetical protein CLIB1423_07S03290 [[Candida] railenensis]|uniref:Nitrogen regulatory protein areA GATA-like domain-containing protein n=1 Tax=[Candida] railenensis TaxID=45579 RepID=A0A9P0QQ83_9ASCO|nr:hypothetical protein CLIB1423_07S03290 [[Candida] railenensis]